MSSTDSFKHSRRLNKVLNELDYQPEWRTESDRCFQYYDGNQLEASVIAELHRRRQPVIITNLIQPTINGVLGMEARNRTDWFVQADDDEFTEVAEGLNVRVNEGLRTANANRACGDAYKSEVIAGIGWVEVKRNKDPFGSKYKITPVHRDELAWDWKSEADLSNCSWLLRHRWVDKDEAKAAFPDHEELIEQTVNQWAGFDMSEFERQGDSLSHAYDEYQYSTRGIHEWLNDVRDQVKVYELYYRVWDKAVVLFLGNGSVVEFDDNNPIHIAAVASGKVKIEKRIVPKLRLSWYVGPHFIADMASPHPHNEYPYIPFFGVQEDRTRRPYGLARHMLTPQDEVNFRRIKLTAQLNSKRVTMDEDATKMDDDDLMDAVHASDGIIKLNPAARRKGGGMFSIETDAGIASQQFQIMQESKQVIQDVIGVFNASLGKESGAQSGVAINSLVEQGATTLAEMNENYRESRRKVGELIMAYEVDETKEQPNIVVQVPKKLGEPKKEIILNKNDGGKITNAVARAKTQVVMSEIQQSPGYRAQITEMLTKVISQLPPEIQMASLDMMVEQMDLPMNIKERLLKNIQKVTGEVDPEEMSEEQRAAMEEQQNDQRELKEMEKKRLQLELEELSKRIAKLDAEANLTQEKAETENSEQAKMAAEIASMEDMPPPLPAL